MRNLTLTALCVLAVPCMAAPALAEKPPRWEYAELKCNRYLMAPPAQPGMKGVAAVPTVAIRWVTADEEIEATEWSNLADKLKTPAAKKEASILMHRLRVFRKLGEDGWEVMEHTGSDGTSGASSWTFKRRVP